ncbi:MAG: HAMP domain-containing sensor histidine kinase [Eubacteriales bacterium]
MNYELFNQLNQGLVVAKEGKITFINGWGAEHYKKLEVGGAALSCDSNGTISLGGRRCTVNQIEEGEFTIFLIHETESEGLTEDQRWGMFSQMRENLATLSAQTQKLHEEGIDTNGLHKSIASLSRLVSNGETIEEPPLQKPTTPLDIAGLMRELLDESSSLLAPLGYELSSKIPPSVLIHGETHGLRRVMLGLISNSAKYSKTIQIKLENQSGRAIITVRDQGKIKGDLHQALHGTSLLPRPEEGARMGFSVIRKIVEQHEGTILVNQGAEGGLEATLSFPTINLQTAKFSTSGMGGSLLSPDRSGGISDLLLELCDILPEKYFEELE